MFHTKGPFTNYFYKRRGVGGQKKLTFCKLLYHRKCKRSGVGGQKKTNLVNVVCERPLTPIYLIIESDNENLRQAEMFK